MPASASTFADGDHVVQFYSDDAILLGVAARFVGAALVGGDSAVVIATAAHERALHHRLLARGFDLDVAAGQSRYVTVDAARFVEEVVTGGALDAKSVRRLAGSAIARARAAAESDPPRAVVFGEAVDLLLSGGNVAAAIDLEKACNALQREQPFALLCSYRINSFRGEQPAAPFLQVCGQHSHVFPAERRRAAPRLTPASAAGRR